MSATSSEGPADVYDSDRAHHSPLFPNISGFQLLRTSKFWLLLIMLGLLGGVGLMTINNIGNDAKALWTHYDDSASHDFVQKRQFVHVGIISLLSFIGRLSSGIGSDWLIHHGLSRFWTLVCSASIFTAAQTIGLTLEDPNQLYWLSGLTGLAYGALFGVYPALIADAFGASGMAINWGAMIMAPVVSGNIFNLAYGTILDHHSVFKGDSHGGERVCDEGRQCYANAYWVTLISSLVGVAWAMWCVQMERAQLVRERSKETQGYSRTARYAP